MSPQSTGTGVFGALLVIGALVLVLYLVRESALLRNMRVRGISTTATVVNHRRQANGLDRAVIAFIDQRGCQVEFVPKRALLNEFVPVGERFEIVYTTEAPEQARLDKNETRRRSLIPLAVFSVVLFVLGVLFLIGILPQKTESVTRVGTPFLTLYLLAMVLVGLAVLALYGWRFRRLLALRREGVHTTGIVTRLISRHDENGGRKRALIEFVDPCRRRIQFASAAAPRKIGVTVGLVYRPDRPQEAEITPVLGNARRFVVGVLFSLTFLVIGAVMLVSL